MTVITGLIILTLLIGLSMVRLEDREDKPRRSNGQYRRKIPVRELGKVTSYIYL